MNSDKKNKIGAGEQSGFSKIDKVHPIKMLLYLSMVGIGVLFIILTIAYANSDSFSLTGITPTLPKFFSISTVLLLISSYTISRTSYYYKRDRLNKLKKFLGFTLLLGFGFVLAQLAGWNEFATRGVTFTGKASGTYIYLISALHMLHLLGGIIFMAFLFFKTVHASSDAVRSLIFIRDPSRQMQIDMLTSYWHFMDFLWVGLYFFFLFFF
ncbi:cytochrome c oxidase subunit 3 [soil metagenome]